MQSNKWLFIYFLLNGNVLMIVLLCLQNMNTCLFLREMWRNFYKRIVYHYLIFHFHASVRSILNNIYIYMNLGFTAEWKWIHFSRVLGYD